MSGYEGEDVRVCEGDSSSRVTGRLTDKQTVIYSSQY